MNVTKNSEKVTRCAKLKVFRVYERPMVTDSLNLKLRQIAKFSPNVTLDEMSSAKGRLLRRKTTLCTCGNFSFCFISVESGQILMQRMLVSK